MRLPLLCMLAPRRSPLAPPSPPSPSPSAKIPDVLDPTLGSAYVSRIVYAAMCDKLIDIDEHLNLVPQLATAWDYEDPTHLVLHPARPA